MSASAVLGFLEDWKETERIEDSFLEVPVSFHGENEMHVVPSEFFPFLA